VDVGHDQLRVVLELVEHSIAARSAAHDCATVTRRSSPRAPAARQNAPCRSADRGCPSGKP
jgi:hypothetical protein